MGRDRRAALIKQIADARKSFVVTYVTSTRQGLETQMGDDAVRVIFDHLKAKAAETKHIDLFIHSNGGSGTVPWRLVNLIREHAKKFGILIPHKAYSAATLTALGADEIVMHPMGELGPIDPSVANAFNPRDPVNPAQPMPISVEDVQAYVSLVKEDVGIRHEDELVQALTAFTNSANLPIHPLALGNVKRHQARSRLVAKKLLMTHMEKADEDRIERIVENLTSKLFYHGHPISRREAKDDLELKIEKDTPESTLDAMWELYLEYEQELVLRTPFILTAEIDRAAAAAAAAGGAPGAPAGGQPQQMPLQGPGGMPIFQMQQMAQPTQITVQLKGLKGAIIESEARCDVFETDLQCRRLTIAMGPTVQEAVRAEPVRLEWRKVS